MRAFPFLLAACLASPFALAQTATPAPASQKPVDPYQTDPANGDTKPTPAKDSDKVPVAAPPNAAADTKQETAKSDAQSSAGMKAGVVIHHVSPRYPETALRGHISGKVTLDIKIDKDGNVHDIKFVDGPEIFRTAAIDAVSKWQYTPWLWKGQPTPAEIQVDVAFKTRDH